MKRDLTGLKGRLHALDRERDANYAFVNILLAALAGLIIASAAFFTFLAIALGAAHKAHAHDRDGHWARLSAEGKAPPAEWWNALGSGKGLCCSFADGAIAKDVDWSVQNEGQHCKKVEGDGNDYQGTYCVRLLGEWWLVPKQAVITEPNRFGPAVVWPVWANIVKDGATIQILHDIRCFLPGAGA